MMNKDITIITGFFKINRESWKGFELTDEKYFEFFKVWAKLQNKLIVYVESEELKKKVIEFRANLGLASQTIVNVVPDCVKLAPDLYNSIKTANESPIQQKFHVLPNHPEVWNPTYNYIMLLKAWCVCDAIDRGQADGMVAWIDFGYNHGGSPIDKNSDFNFKWEYDFPEKINLFTIQDLDNRPMFEIILSMDTYTMGGFLVGPANLWHEFWNLLKSSMMALNDCGLADDDQNIILMAYRKKPEIFYLNKSYWSVQLKQFGGEHLQWAPEFLEYRDSLKKKNFKNWARGIKHKVNCLKYAWRIYKHMSKVKIH